MEDEEFWVQVSHLLSQTCLRVHYGLTLTGLLLSLSYALAMVGFRLGLPVRRNPQARPTKTLRFGSSPSLISALPLLHSIQNRKHSFLFDIFLCTFYVDSFSLDGGTDKSDPYRHLPAGFSRLIVQSRAHLASSRDELLIDNSPDEVVSIEWKKGQRERQWE